MADEDETPLRRFEMRIIFSTREELPATIEGEQWVADVLAGIGVREGYIRMAYLNQVILPRATMDWSPPV